ncbi:MAG TPA: DUF5691 domain-containing protein [Mycobacteriales bacterium]|nr:DUF5691 domain-containing protein [Mycobacteriales bacterium]
MTSWADLSAAALLGTARRDVDVTALPGPLGTAAARLTPVNADDAAVPSPGGAGPSADGTAGAGGGVVRSAAGDPAARLLDAAALATPYRRAGMRPGVAPVESGPAAGPETARLVRPAGAAHLGRVLGGNQDLLVEWAGAAAAGRWRPPADLLPALLDAAARDGAAAAAVVPVLGVRGRWLAAARPDWAQAITIADPSTLATPNATPPTAPSPTATPNPGAIPGPGPTPGPGAIPGPAPGPGATPGPATAPAGSGPAEVDEVWEHGERAERRDRYDVLRAADPARARALLTATWAKETGEDREWFLDQIGVRPQDADEPLLETALRDRRKGVRDRAAATLGVLPRSAYAARMSERARAAVSVERRRLRTRLVVAPPETCDDAMAGDAISRTPPAGIGAQGWWLREIVSATPLPVWSALGPPAQLLGWAGDTDWRDVLVGGWQDAAIRQQDAGWAAALLDRRPPQRDWPALVGALPPDRRGLAVARLLAGKDTTPWLLSAVLTVCPPPWPDELGRAVLARLVRTDVGPRDTGIRDALTLLAHRLPPHRAAAVRDRAGKAGSDWGPALTRVAETLEFRYAMLEELR